MVLASHTRPLSPSNPGGGSSSKHQESTIEHHQGPSSTVKHHHAAAITQNGQDHHKCHAWSKPHVEFLVPFENGPAISATRTGLQQAAHTSLCTRMARKVTGPVMGNQVRYSWSKSELNSSQGERKTRLAFNFLQKHPAPASQTTNGPDSANYANIQHSLDALENRLYQISPEPPFYRCRSSPHAHPRPAGYAKL